MIQASLRKGLFGFAVLFLTSTASGESGGAAAVPEESTEPSDAPPPSASSSVQPNPAAGHPPAEVTAAHAGRASSTFHGAAGQSDLKGSPFDSAAHMELADWARSGRKTQPEVQMQSSHLIPAGTIGVLVKDPGGSPLPNTTVTLFGVKESIKEGDVQFRLTAQTDPAGRAAFDHQPTDSSHRYEISVEQNGAKYAAEPFRMKANEGVFVVLPVFGTSADLKDTFVISRALYAVEPRTDVFQIQALFRLHNAGSVTWLPKDFRIPLPEGAEAFRPLQHTGDIAVTDVGGAVALRGSITPGEHEFSFAYQLPNPGTERVQLAFPTVPNATDARVFLESSSEMKLRVDGFDPSKPTRATSGQAALLSERDFLQARTPPPERVVAVITGLPGRTNAPVYAVILAGIIVSFGVSASLRQRRGVSTEDRARAKQLLLDELLAVEAARRAEEIGVRTYERTKKLLIDALARLGVEPSSGPET